MKSKFQHCIRLTAFVRDPETGLLSVTDIIEIERHRYGRLTPRLMKKYFARNIVHYAGCEKTVTNYPIA